MQCLRKSEQTRVKVFKPYSVLTGPTWCTSPPPAPPTSACRGGVAEVTPAAAPAATLPWGALHTCLPPDQHSTALGTPPHLLHCLWPLSPPAPAQTTSDVDHKWRWPVGTCWSETHRKLQEGREDETDIWRIVCFQSPHNKARDTRHTRCEPQDLKPAGNTIKSNTHRHTHTQTSTTSFVQRVGCTCWWQNSVAHLYRAMRDPHAPTGQIHIIDPVTRCCCCQRSGSRAAVVLRRAKRCHSALAEEQSTVSRLIKLLNALPRRGGLKPSPLKRWVVGDNVVCRSYNVT